MKNIFLVVVLTTLFISCNKTAASQEAVSSEQSKRIKKIEFFDKNILVIAITEFFDEKGNKTKVIYHSADYGDSEATFLYDDTTNDLIEEKEYNTKGELKETKSYVHNYIDGIIELTQTYEERAGKEKRLIIENSFTYNKKGQLIKELHRAVYATYEYEYKYHDNGNEKEKITYAFNGTEKIIKKSNTDGNRILEEIYRRKTIDDNFKLDMTNNWYYDKDGNEITLEGNPVESNDVYTKEYTYY